MRQFGSENMNRKHALASMGSIRKMVGYPGFLQKKLFLQQGELGNSMRIRQILKERGGMVLPWPIGLASNFSGLSLNSFIQRPLNYQEHLRFLSAKRFAVWAPG